MRLPIPGGSDWTRKKRTKRRRLRQRLNRTERADDRGAGLDGSKAARYAISQRYLDGWGKADQLLLNAFGQCQHSGLDQVRAIGAFMVGGRAVAAAVRANPAQHIH